MKVRTDAGQNISIHDGLFVQAWIAARHKDNAVTLPIESLSFRNRVPFIYVVGDDNRVTRRDVSIGLRGLGKTEITTGLQVGDKVVVRGQHLLDTNSLVKVLPPKGEVKQ